MRSRPSQPRWTVSTAGQSRLCISDCRWTRGVEGTEGQRGWSLPPSPAAVPFGAHRGGLSGCSLQRCCSQHSLWLAVPAAEWQKGVSYTLGFLGLRWGLASYHLPRTHPCRWWVLSWGNILS